ncbi:hypothetical protein IJH24_03565 [Candidatus Saccharibacteria bacterium]|nr:hypothetical protein [Candidatus Saccharibacteria bacterium]
MDNWSKEEMAELRKFWKGDIGKKYIKRMEDTKKQLLQAAMGTPTRDDVVRYVAIANGFDSVLQDIEAVVNLEKEKEGAAKKK